MSFVRCLVVIGGTLCADARAIGADVFVTIGGGPEPANNQVSLEKNVEFFKRTLAGQRDDAPRHDIFFADGNSPYRDLQFRDSESEISDAVMWLSTLTSTEHEVDLAYRNHQLSPVAGPLRKAFLKQRFDELSQSMVAGDRLLVYVTAHGGPAQESFGVDDGGEYQFRPAASNPQDTTIALWNDETLSMTEFALWLDRFSPEVEIVMVMAQCYAGGFAHAIYHNGNRRLGLNGRPWCGFFAQRHDRPAAGCTPEVLEAEYQDYSTFFWAALQGESRLGEPIESADYDEDGRVSFAEAHAYCLITSHSVDIPLRTTAALLRRYSKLGTAGDAPSEEERPTLSGTVANLFGSPGKTDEEASLVYDAAGLLTRQSTIGGAIELSSPDQRVVIERLADELNLPLETTVQQVQRKFRQAGKGVNKRTEAYGVVAAEYSVLRSQLVELAMQQYPELNRAGYTPIMTELTTARADEFLEFIGQQTQAEALTSLAERMTKASERVTDAEAREARLGRLLGTVEDCLLEENLPVTATEDVLQQYARMLGMEQGTL